ncbi:MAG: nitroreductase family protein [Acidimicrobiales bacterium]
MELGEAIRQRRMTRDFSDRPVPPETVDRLLDRARRAPSAGNTQGWSFLVLEGADQTGRFWAAGAEPEWLADQDLPGVLRAPVVVVPFCSKKAYLDRYSEPDKAAHGLTAAERWPAPFWIVDVSFATMLLLLGAVEEGLGALFFGVRGDHERLRAEFSVPAEWEPIGAVALGWRVGDGGPGGSASRGRKAIDDLVHRGRW